MTAVLVLLGVLGAILLAIMAMYNGLVTARNLVKNAFAQIEVQLKRRYDLIPNLIEVAKKYMAHERDTLESVISARNAASAGLAAAAADPGNSGAMKNLTGAEGALAGAMGRLNVVMEDYPELKANETMMQLSEELTSTENRVAFSRQAFNDAVTAYNEFRQSFPPKLFAATFGHAVDAELLQFADSEAIQQAPKVSFD